MDAKSKKKLSNPLQAQSSKQLVVGRLRSFLNELTLKYANEFKLDFSKMYQESKVKLN